MAVHLSPCWQYIYNRGYRDNVSHCNFIEHVSFNVDKQQVLVCEGELPQVRVYSKSMRLLRTIRTDADQEKDKPPVPLRAVMVPSVSQCILLDNDVNHSRLCS